MSDGDEEILPEHMAPWVRNKRLYEHLKSMGLFVVAVPYEDDPTKISWIQVASLGPTVTLGEMRDRLRRNDERLVPACVDSPLKGPEIGDSVSPVGVDVIDFPAKD